MVLVFGIFRGIITGQATIRENRAFEIKIGVKKNSKKIVPGQFAY
jgi:hypothetical protein